MGTLSGTRPTAPTGLVRNVSLPVLSYGVPSSPAVPTTHPRAVPRVSSFSRMVKPSAAPLYRPSDDDDADGMVPDLEPHEDLLREPSHPIHRRPRSYGYDGDIEGESVTDSEDSLGPNPIPRHHSSPDAACASGSDAHDAEHLHLFQHTTAVSAPPSALYVNSLSLDGDSWLVGHIRYVLVRAITSLHIFVPSAARASAMGTSDVEAKFLFVSSLSIMIAVSAMLFALVLSFPRPLLVASIAITFAPLVGLLSGSLALATGVCACGVIAFAIAAARLASPVLLVWTSLVPVLVFGALGTRAGVVASFATAAAVAAADLSSPLPEGRISPAAIIAAWVLFLGLTGVVQTQIRKMKMRNGRAGSSGKWTDEASCEEEFTADRPWSGQERKFGEQVRWGRDGIDAMVPDAAIGVVPTARTY